jgi:hypothetical protein
MADLAQTITGSVRCFGPGNASVWGTFVWGVDDWGSNDDSRIDVGKAVSDNCTVADVLAFDSTKPLANSISAANELTTLTLQDSAGFFVVFPSETTNGSLIASSVFSKVSDQTTSFTIVTFNTVPWSKV